LAKKQRNGHLEFQAKHLEHTNYTQAKSHTSIYLARWQAHFIFLSWFDFAFLDKSSVLKRAPTCEDLFPAGVEN
jgi:hypothetical protein